MTNRFFIFVLITATTCCGLSLGCGEDTPDGGGTPGPTLTNQTFIVASIEKGSGVLGAAIEGATVAFDIPGGGRTEMTTGTDGMVTFTGINWAAGMGAVTAHVDGYALWSSVNLTPATIALAPTFNGEIVLPMIEMLGTPPQYITVTGTVTGLLDTAHNVVVNSIGTATRVETEWQGAFLATFSVRVPVNTPYTLQVMEITQVMLSSGQGYELNVFQVAHLDFAAASVDVTGAALDFAGNTVATSTADLTVALPARATSTLADGSPVCFVIDPSSNYVFGWGSLVDINTAGDGFDVSLIWTEPTWATLPSAYCRVVNSSADTWSIVDTLGYPQDGSLGTFVDVVEWVPHYAPGFSAPLHSEMEWEIFDTSVDSHAINIFRANDIIWRVGLDAASTTATVPDPPSSVDTAAFIGTADLEARMVSGNLRSGAVRFERWAVSDSTPLAP